MAGKVKDVTVRINVDDSDIPKTGKDFDKLNKDVVKGTKQMESSFGSLNKSILKIGASLGGAFAVKQLITNAVKTIAEFDQAMADLGAITGATGKTLDGFKNEVLKVSQVTGKGASDIAKAFQLVGSAQPELLKSAAALGEVTKQAVLLAQAGGLEVPEAANSLTLAMNQFGASAADAAMFTDILATSQQKGTATILQLSEALKNVGAVANAAGLSFEETNVALQALAKGGLVGAEAGTGLRGVLSRLSSQADREINPSLTDLTEVIENLSEKNLNLESATKLVGLENAKSLLTLVAQKDVVNELTGALNEQGNAAGQAAQRMDTISGKTERLSSAYERFLLSIEDGEGALGKFIAGIIDLGTASLNALSGVEKIEDKTTLLYQTTKKYNEALSEEKESMNQLFRELTNSNTPLGVRQSNIGTLNKLYGDYLPNLLTENSSLDDIKNAQNLVNTSMKENIGQRILLSQLQESQNKFSSREEELIEQVAKTYGKSTGEVIKFIKSRQTATSTASAELRLATDSEFESLEKQADAFFGTNKASGDYAVSLLGVTGALSELLNINVEAQKEQFSLKDIIKELTLAELDNAEATDTNTDAKNKQLSAAQKLLKLQADAKKKAEEEFKAANILNDDFEEPENEDFLKLVGLDKEGLEKMKAAAEEEKEIQAQRDADKLEGQLAFNELTLEQEREAVEAKKAFNEEIALSSFGLAAALAQAINDGNAAQNQALAFDKLAAIASIIINTQKANALLSAQLGVLAPPAIIRNNIAGAIAVATVAATAIPQFKAINKKKEEPKKLKDGEVLINGAGTETSDSIPAMLSRNESVINARSSKKHTAALKAINDDRFEDYLNRVVTQRLYMGKSDRSKKAVTNQELKVNIPNGYKILNPSSVSKPIVDAIEESNFIRRNGWA